MEKRHLFGLVLKQALLKLGKQRSRTKIKMDRFRHISKEIESSHVICMAQVYIMYELSLGGNSLEKELVTGGL